ncbi:MAG: hypothetical protein ACRDZY_22975, partial [Acidimicrobiales bacterium]
MPAHPDAGSRGGPLGQSAGGEEPDAPGRLAGPGGQDPVDPVPAGGPDAAPTGETAAGPADETTTVPTAGKPWWPADLGRGGRHLRGARGRRWSRSSPEGAGPQRPAQGGLAAVAGGAHAGADVPRGQARDVDDGGRHPGASADTLVTAGDPAAGAPIAAKVGDGHGDDGPSGGGVHPGGEPERSAAKGFGGVRSGAAAAVAVLVLAVAGAATALAITSGSGPSPVASTTSGRPPATKTTTSTPPAPTPTVVQTSLQPSSAVAGGATYPTRGQSLHLTLTATGPCWIEVRATPTSPVIWTGTLQAGMSHT